MNRKRAIRSLTIWPQTGPPSIQQNVYAVSRESCYKSDDASKGVENNCRSNKVHTRIVLPLSCSSTDVVLEQGQPGVTRLVAKCGQSQRPSGKREWMTCGLRLKLQPSSGGNDRREGATTTERECGLRGEERDSSVWTGYAKRIGVALCGHRQARWIVARA